MEEKCDEEEDVGKEEVHFEFRFLSIDSLLFCVSFVLGWGFRDSNDALPRGISIFQQQGGGVKGVSESGVGRSEEYFVGIIDMLQTYTITKQMERGIKRARGQDKLGISSTKSDIYKDRFIMFIKEILRLEEDTPFLPSIETEEVKETKSNQEN